MRGQISSLMLARHVFSESGRLRSLAVGRGLALGFTHAWHRSDWGCALGNCAGFGEVTDGLGMGDGMVKFDWRGVRRF